MVAIRARNWAAADAAASQMADPVARKLVLFYRLLTPNAASLSEIGQFMARSPDWPLQGTLARRRDEALALEPDETAVRAQCQRTDSDIAAAPALLRCADALGRAGQDGATLIRRAWLALPSDPAAEAQFTQSYGAALTPADQWARFDRLAWSDTAGATRQAVRLAEDDHPRAEARLALRRDDASAPALVAALPQALWRDPGIMLERARWLRRAGQDGDAQAVWRSDGHAAETAAPADRRALFWDERNILARRLLRSGDDVGAYALASDHAQNGAQMSAAEARGDAEFLAGFIALRRLHDPALATRHFQTLADISRAAITQGRAQYWLGRAAEARNDRAAAARAFTAGAAWPNTFYGQRAALAGGETPAALAARILATRDPSADPDRALALAGRELARAATVLVAWGERARADAFLLRLTSITPDAPDQALTARLASGFGAVELAVAVARRAGREGVVLLEAGWPIAADIPEASGVEPALALGIIRQESSFDTTTTSPVGARGLMQLMPGTAAQEAHKLGLPVSVPALTLDPAYNIRLGTDYLRGLMDRFASIPLAAAGYNAGPNRVADWLAANGDPRTAETEKDAAMIDWIELIPFGETRNYVQRVTENTVVYRAKLGLPAHDPLLP